jgi:hypothetical protein
MNPIMKPAILLFLTLACTTPRTPPESTPVAPAVDPSLAGALSIVLAEADPSGQSTLIIRSGTPTDVRASAASLRKVIDETAAGAVAEELSQGYIRLTETVMEGDRATVRLTTGPIARPSPGVISMSCGTTRSFRLERAADGKWTIASRAISTC